MARYTVEDDQRIEFEEQAARKGNRLRIVLVIIIILLILLMGGVGYLFVSVLRPAAQPAQETTTGMTWIRSLYGYGPAVDEQLQEPVDVAIAPNGDIYVGDPYRARIMVFGPSGAFSRVVQGSPDGGPGAFVRPESLSISDTGELFVSDSRQGKILVYGSNDTFQREWEVEEAVGGLHVAGDEVFVLFRDKIVVYSLSGEEVGRIEPGRGPAPGQLDANRGIAYDGERIYVTDTFNARVQAFSREGELLWAVPASRDDTTVPEQEVGIDEEHPPFSPPYDLPMDLTLDGSGRVVVLDAFAFALIVVDAETGVPLAAYGESGERDGQLFYPSGIDYDPVRDWFAVADTRNNRVQILRISGSGGTAASAVARALSSPWRYCAVPVVVLILALLVLLVSRRRRRRWEPDSMPEDT